MTVYRGHIVAAGCEELGIDKPTAVAHHLSIPGPRKDKQSYVNRLAQKVVERCTLIEEPFLRRAMDSGTDHVFNYARQICHFSSLVAEFTDAWGEGDGERVTRCWKFFLPHFYATHRTKYALQALHLLLQLKLSQPKLIHQLTWGRFVNTRGGKGKNIPCDLHNEHVNCVFKEVVGNMGSNFTQQSSTRVARCITSLHTIAEKFDIECSVPRESSSHTTKSDISDVEKVIQIVLRNQLIQKVSTTREHSSHPRVTINPLANLDTEKMDRWMKEKFELRRKYRVVYDGMDSDADQDNTDSSQSEDES